MDPITQRLLRQGGVDSERLKTIHDLADRALGLSASNLKLSETNDKLKQYLADIRDLAAPG